MCGRWALTGAVWQVRLAELSGSSDLIPREEVVLTSPLTNINKILGIGLNYKDGAAELVSPTMC